MKICHVCLYECEDDRELCPICGAELRAAEEEKTEKEEKAITEPVLAVSVEDVVTAEIFRDVLKENNIPFTCDSAEEEGAMKVLFGGGFVAEDIYVDASDLEEAQRLYDEVLASEPQFSDDFSEEFEEE